MITNYCQSRLKTLKQVIIGTIIMTTHSLKDKVVLITGGAKNLGGLISRKFA
ncbi:hypothetical protein J726_4146, partial [Acinetobacter baumannii 1262761-105]